MSKDKADLSILKDMDFGEMVDINMDTSILNQDDVTQGDNTQVIDDTPPEDTKTDDKAEEISVTDVLKETIDTEDKTSTTVDDTVNDVDKTDSQDSDDTKNKTGDKSEESFALVFAKFQSELGNLTEFNEEDYKKIIEEEGEDVAIRKLFEGEINLNKDEIKNTYDTYSQEYINMRESGVPQGESVDLIAEKETLDGITEDQITDDAALRRDLLIHNFKSTTKFSDDKIKKLVDRTIDLGDDVDEAKEALDSLKGYNTEAIKASKQREKDNLKAIEDQRAASAVKLKEVIKSYDEIIPGHKITQPTKTKIEEMITKPVKKNNDGVLLNSVWAKRDENALKFDTTLAYLINLGVFDGKWDKVITKEKTNAVKSLKNHLDNNSGTAFKGGRTNTQSNTYSTESDMLASMKGMLK